MKNPLPVDRYNRSMNGVDCNDQCCVYYLFVHKTLKWWRKLFFYLLECATMNSYILYREAVQSAGTKPLTSLEYHHSIVQILAQEHLLHDSHPSVGRQRLGPVTTRLNKRLHLLDHQPSAPVWSIVEKQGTQHVFFAKHALSSQPFTPPSALPHNATLLYLVTLSGPHITLSGPHITYSHTCHEYTYSVVLFPFLLLLSSVNISGTQHSTLCS